MFLDVCSLNSALAAYCEIIDTYNYGEVIISCAIFL